MSDFPDDHHTDPTTGDKLRDRLTAIAAGLDGRRDTGAVLWRATGPGGFSWTYGDTTRPFAVASITKMFTTAIVFQLIDEGKMSLDDAVAQYLEPEVLGGLNTYRGVDHGARITVRQLVTHTSGIPNYFDATSGVLPQLLREDFSWTPAEALTRARSMRARFAPGASRAQYSDTNYIVLGMLIDVLDSSFAESLQRRLVRPLQLRKTGLLGESSGLSFSELAPIRGEAKDLHIPLGLASVGAHGGMVSNLEESSRLLAAFLSGELFSPRWLTHLCAKTHRVQGPLEYGLGVMRYELAGIFNLLAPMPALTGHSGSTGSVLYATDDREIVISGTTNQITNQALSHRALARIAATMKMHL